MSEANEWEWAEVAEATDYGRLRREQWLAEKQASTDDMMSMLSGAGRADHQAAHDHLTRSTHGLFGASTGQQLGQAAAEQPATVGGDFGQARPLERNGHLAESIGPSPARVDLTRVNDRPGYQQGDDRPILRYLRGEQ